MRQFVLHAVILWAALCPCTGAETLNDELEAGRSIYYSMTRPDGSAVRAMVQGDVPLPEGSGACVNCHRRSGLGVAEGGARALDITGPSLFQAREVPPERAAYDDKLLMRAIVAGIDSNGDPLDVLMPRYRLSADDATALAAYLRRLGTEIAPGVSKETLELATVILPDSPDVERDALKRIIPEYIDVKNAGSRQERRRAAASARQFYGIKRYRAYREWKHTFWELSGPPDTWRTQLQARYDDSTPFAMLSGSIGQHSDIVHDFCEQNQLACILPMTDYPPEEGEGFYSLYFSSGMRLEAQVIGNHIATPGSADVRTPLLVYNDDASGSLARDTIVERAGLRGGVQVDTHGIRPGSKPSVKEWRALLSAHATDTLVLLLAEEQLENLMLPKFDTRELPSRIITAESFTDWSQSPYVASLTDRLLHVYPYSLVRPGISQFPREDVWLRSRGIDVESDVAAAKVLFACKALGMALADIQTNFSREYLLESLEHALDNNLMTSLFPRTTLGPDQRYLSRGAYLGRVSNLQRGAVVTDGVWVQP